jgi:hypothetical protein
MTTRESTTRVAWNVLQKEKAALLWTHPKTRARMKAKSNKDRKSVEGMTGAQSEYPLDVWKAIFD